MNANRIAGRALRGATGLLIFTVLLCGCGESYRVEPLLLENRETARHVVANYDDAARITQVEGLVAHVIKALQEERCGDAWGLLTQGYRQRFVGVAGGEEEARTQFCEGYRVSGEMLVKGDWVSFLLGTQAFYVTTVPPELGLEQRSEEELFYVVQRNGTYRALLVVREGSAERIEPL